MAMSFEEAQRITNQKLAKQRKGYLAENAYRQSDENRERIKNRLVSIAEATTPLGDVQTGIDAKTAYDEGRYLDAAGNAAMIVAGYTPFGPLAKAGKAGYKSLNQANKYRKFKNEAAKRSGPLSPHYMNRTTGNPRMDKLANQNVANMSIQEQLENMRSSAFNQQLARLNPDFKNANSLMTGQGGPIPKGMTARDMSLYDKNTVSLSKQASTADEYAKIAGVGDGTPNTGKRLVALPYGDQEKFIDFTEMKVSNPSMKTHGGHELRIPPKQLQKTFKNLVGGKPLSFPASSATDNLWRLQDMSDDQFKNWASKNVFSKGGKVK